MKIKMLCAVVLTLLLFGCYNQKEGYEAIAKEYPNSTISTTPYNIHSFIVRDSSDDVWYVDLCVFKPEVKSKYLLFPAKNKCE